MASTSDLETLVTRSIERARAQGADAAEATLIQETGFSVSARMGSAESLEHHQEKGLSLTVYLGQRCGSASTSDFSPAAIDLIVQKACDIARFTGEDPCSGLADAHLMAQDIPDLQLFHPWDIAPDKAMEIALACETLARESDTRIKSTESAEVSTYSTSKIMANTHGFLGRYSATRHSLHCALVAEEKGQMQTGYEYTSARHPNDLMDYTRIAKKAAEKAVARLGARSLSTQQSPVLFDASVAKGLLGHFISAISGGALYRGFSFLSDHLGQRVFPEFITLHQDPHLLSAMGSAPFDSEGVQTQKINYVTDGVLNHYLLGSYSARKLGLQSTGNAGGVYNLMVSHSNQSFSDLLKTMDRGLLVTELMGQGVNIANGNYSRGASGFWVEHGEIQYPVEEITIAGNLKDLFSNLVAVGSDLDDRGRIRTGSILLDRMTIAGS